jgi:Carboxypeptidase regulatory-like domain
MWAGSKLVGIFLVYLLLSLFNVFAAGQTQTSGRNAGIVRDAQGAVVAGAEVVVDNLAIADKRSVKSDVSGNYSVPLLPPSSMT